MGDAKESHYNSVVVKPLVQLKSEIGYITSENKFEILQSHGNYIQDNAYIMKSKLITSHNA